MTEIETAAGHYPVFPPGLWRRIVLQPEPGWIGGALEDDMHRFHIRLDHEGGRITRVTAKVLRHPWSACTGAAGFIAQELAGEQLEDVARRDPFQHCTHLFDLAVLASAHARDAGPTRFDMHVADRIDGRTTAILNENGEEKLRWQLDGTAIAGRERDLRQFSRWKRELPAEDAERAGLLRRAVFVSGARQYVPPVIEQTAAENSGRMGVCFNYQLPQAETSTRTPDWHKDFSTSGYEPLEGFDPAGDFEPIARP